MRRKLKRRSDSEQEKYDSFWREHSSPSRRGGDVLPNLHLARCSECGRSYFTAGLDGEEGSGRCCDA